MSNLQAPQKQPTVAETDRYANALRTTAAIALIACPALALLPPRKLDFYTVGLITATGYSANFLIRERTGRSIYQHLSPRRNAAIAHQHNSVPPTEQANLHRELVNASEQLQRVNKQERPVTEEIMSQREAWKTQREKEIKDDLEEGKGLSDMIFDQIWEVWNWRKRRDEDEDE